MGRTDRIADAGEAVRTVGRPGDRARLLAEDNCPLGAAQDLPCGHARFQTAEDEQRDWLAQIGRRLALRAHQIFREVALGPNPGGLQVLCRHYPVGLQRRGEHRQIYSDERVGRDGGQQQHRVIGLVRPAVHVRGTKIPGIELGAGGLGIAVDSVSRVPEPVARPALRGRHGLVIDK